MRYIKPLLIIIISCFCFNACIPVFHQQYSGLWFFTYSNGETSSEFKLTPASYFCLNPDSSYTLDFGKFEYGRWSLKKNMIEFIASNRTVHYFTINNKSGNDLKLTTEPGIISDFEKQSYSFSTTAAQPFSLANNQWRNPAHHKETPAEIKVRLINHCRFLETYFTWALNNNISTIDVRSTPSLIKIYGNGFTLKPFNELPVAWRNYFYDSADCMHANKMLEDVMLHNDIAWAHTDNKYKMFIGAFEQLEQLLKREPA